MTIPDQARTKRLDGRAAGTNLPVLFATNGTPVPDLSFWKWSRLFDFAISDTGSL
jgi:hypothetical protein